MSRNSKGQCHQALHQQRPSTRDSTKRFCTAAIGIGRTAAQDGLLFLGYTCKDLHHGLLESVLTTSDHKVRGLLSNCIITQSCVTSTRREKQPWNCPTSVAYAVKPPSKAVPT